MQGPKIFAKKENRLGGKKRTQQNVVVLYPESPCYSQDPQYTD